MLTNVYHKPVIAAEVGYEGNLKSRWGRYNPEEMAHLVWNGVMGGTYVTHGESYMFKDASDTIFWAKGGTFDGTSWRRMAFLRKLLEEGPGPLSMADVSRDFQTSTAGQGTYLVYFGKEVREECLFNLPIKNSSFAKAREGNRYQVEIIDTWDMTVRPYPGTFTLGAETDYRLYDKDLRKVRLPAKAHIALRITALK